MTIRFAPDAEIDFTTVIEYLTERNPVAASELGHRIFEILDKLDAGGIEGVEQVIDGELVRSWAVPPVRIYYRREATSLWILRIYHQARRPLR